MNHMDKFLRIGMMRLTFCIRARLELIIAVVLISSGSSFAVAIPVGQAMRELIEADWIQQDSRFVPEENAQAFEIEAAMK